MLVVYYCDNQISFSRVVVNHNTKLPNVIFSQFYINKINIVLRSVHTTHVCINLH